MTKDISILHELAKFNFHNVIFGLLEEVKDETYVKLDRECRTAPFEGMNQPTPIGGMLGYEVVLKIKHAGQPAEFPWELYTLPDELVEFGVTNTKGHSRNLNIPLPYGETTDYQIKIFQPKEKPEEDEFNQELPDATK